MLDHTEWCCQTKADKTQSGCPDAGERAELQRDILYGTLEDIARQLRQLEPESITPKLIESAVRWRGVTLEAAKEQVGETEDLDEVLGRLVAQTPSTR